MHSDWQMCAGDSVFGSTRAGNLLQNVEIIPGCHAFFTFQKVDSGEIH